jgi:site-specific recombinase XerD
MMAHEIKEQFTEYLKRECKCTEISVKNYFKHIEKYAKFAASIGFLDILKIDSYLLAHDILKKIQKAGHFRTKEPLSDCYIYKIGAMVSCFWKFALKYEYKEGKNPFENGWGFSKPQYGTIEFYDRDSDIMKQIMAYPLSIKDRAIFHVLFACGPRRLEVNNLQISKISEEGIWIIKGKNGKTRLVPISKIAWDSIHLWIMSLRARGYTGDWLFPNSTDQSRPMCDDNLYKRVRIVGEKLGIKLYPRMFRRAFITDSIEKGNPLTLTADWAGHDDIRTTQIYVRHTQKFSREQYRKTMEMA